MRSDEAGKARRNKIENRVRRGTREMILEGNVPEDANFISGSFVITIKNVEAENPTFKARFVAHDNKDSEKNQLMHDSPTARQSSVRLLAALAAIMRFDVWAEDMPIYGTFLLQ